MGTRGRREGEDRPLADNRGRVVLRRKARPRQSVRGPGAKQEPPANGPFFARCRSCGTRVQFFAPDQMRTFRCCPSPDFEVE